MPITFRYRAPSISASSDSSIDSSDPTVTDADDSIILRTGEASRLRRRGAIRLDHAPGSHGVAQGSASNTRGISNDRNDSTDGPANQSETESRRSDLDGEGQNYGYSLFCGGFEPEVEADEDLVAPFEPAILPNSPVQPPPFRRSIRSNGCGALIHAYASPRNRLGVWTAKSPATDVVVPLESSYFDRAAVAKIVRNACGCVREGVGCAVCGNPLGTRYKPCPIAADNLFSHSSRQALPIRPSGPRYWHQPSPSIPRPPDSAAASSVSSSDPSSNTPYYVYTFLSPSVSSSPSYAFSPTNYQPTSASTATTAPPSTPPADFPSEGIYTFQVASPIPLPLSEIGEDQIIQDGDEGASFDRDGVPIDDRETLTEPNSPDKSGSELMLAPER